jgi:hypothetical protein
MGLEYSWDTLLLFGNLILPNKPTDQIVPDGHPGLGGK